MEIGILHVFFFFLGFGFIRLMGNIAFVFQIFRLGFVFLFWLWYVTVETEKHERVKNEREKERERKNYFLIQQDIILRENII